MRLDQFLHFHWAQLNATSSESPPLTTCIMPFLGHMTLEHYTLSETILFDFLYLMSSLLEQALWGQSPHCQPSNVRASAQLTVVMAQVTLDTM